MEFMKGLFCAKDVFVARLHQAANKLSAPHLTPQLDSLQAGIGICRFWSVWHVLCLFAQTVHGCCSLYCKIICSCFGYEYVKYGDGVFVIVMLVKCYIA